MARRCELTGKDPSFGRNVSHANNKTSRRFVPNLQRVTLHSEALRGPVRLRISTRALRSIQKVGGLDAFLLATDDAKLTAEGRRLKRRVRRALSGAGRRRATTAA